MREGYCEICGGLLTGPRTRHDVDGVCLMELLPIPKDSVLPPVIAEVPGSVCVNVTPDATLVLRILEAHRESYRSSFDVSGMSGECTAMFDSMNKDNEERVLLLTRAIALLTLHGEDDK